jgi:hypothetical protein
MDKVRLRRIFEWWCPACSVVNLAPYELIEVTEEELRALHDLEPWQEVPEGVDAEAVAMPCVVVCGKCGVEFETDDGVECGVELPESTECFFHECEEPSDPAPPDEEGV